MSQLVKTLNKYFPSRGQALANAIIAGGGDITSAKQRYHLVEMAEIARGDAAARQFLTAEPFHPLHWDQELSEESPFKQALRSYLAEFGHRGVYELDMINPNWREDPSYLLNVVRSSMKTANLSQIKSRQKATADAARQEVMQKVPDFKRRTVHSQIKRVLKGAELRETAKSAMVKLGVSNQRLVFQEIGRRLVGQGVIREQADIYHCAWSEILSILQQEWNGKGLDILVADRKVRRKELEALSPPDFIVNEVAHFTEPVAHSSGQALKGMGVAAGKASGPARVIYHPNEGQKLQVGDVLVAPSTDPGWTPLFLKASAIVMETGGMISHGAIVAREYGIPAVANIPGVLKVIKDGQKITVDGNEGKVYM